MKKLKIAAILPPGQDKLATKTPSVSVRAYCCTCVGLWQILLQNSFLH